MFYIIILLNAFLPGNLIRAETGPIEVVKKYYTADLEGARINGGRYKARITPLITWKQEPGWDTAFVTKKVYISKSEKTKGGKAIVEVRYENAGILGGGIGEDASLLEIKFTEVVIFILVQQGGKWKIQEPIIYPHISPKTLIKEVEPMIVAHKGKNADMVEKLENLINRLKELDRRK
jgi:hypothetical protein